MDNSSVSVEVCAQLLAVISFVVLCSRACRALYKNHKTPSKKHAPTLAKNCRRAFRALGIFRHALSLRARPKLARKTARRRFAAPARSAAAAWVCNTLRSGAVVHVMPLMSRRICFGWVAVGSLPSFVFAAVLRPLTRPPCCACPQYGFCYPC